MHYVEKKIKSGKMFEAELYPVFPSGRRISGGTSKAQAEYNQKQSVKNFIRLINTNFDENSYFLSPTYAPARAPLDEEHAKRDISMFLRRLRRLCKSRGCTLKYAYTVEKVVYKQGQHKGEPNWHYHFFIDAPAVSSREIEDLWGFGVRVNCRNYQPDRFGQSAAASYMMKDPKGKRRFNCSRNLKRPDIKIGKPKYFGKRKIEKLTENAFSADFWEKKYPGYRYICAEPTFNDYNKAWYFHVEMRKLPDHATHPYERRGG